MTGSEIAVRNKSLSSFSQPETIPSEIKPPKYHKIKSSVSSAPELAWAHKSRVFTKPAAGAKSAGKIGLSAAGSLPKAASGVTGNRAVLMAELLLAFGLIGLRAIADYVPDSDPSNPGTQTPPKGANPVLLAATMIGVFFMLAVVANINAGFAKFSYAFGGLVLVSLLMNSSAELQMVGGWVDNAKLGKTTTDGLTSNQVYTSVQIPVYSSATVQAIGNSGILDPANYITSGTQKTYGPNYQVVNPGAPIS